MFGVRTVAGKRLAGALILIWMAVWFPMGIMDAGAAASDTPASPDLLPDLRTLPPTDLRLRVDAGRHKRVLRFANTVWNAGLGPLELRGEQDTTAERAGVFQLIFTEDGSIRERQAGRFIHHPTHHHVHFEGFALYEIWSVGPTRKPETLLVTGGKISYCVMNTTRITADAASSRRYYACDTELQGISPGWGDTYGTTTPGQELDISALPDGLYALRSVADPENRILEMDEDNNQAVTYFVLQKNGSQIARPVYMPTHNQE